MASRSASTGMLVGLVVFVLMSVVFLALSIIFFVGKTAEHEIAVKADQNLAEFIRSEERGRDQAKALQVAAAGNQRSVFGEMAERADATQKFLGSDDVDLAATRTALELNATDTVRGALRDLRQQVRARTDEASSLRTRLADATKQADALKAQGATSDKQHQAALAKVEGTIGDFRAAVEDAQNRMNAAITSFETFRAELEETQRNTMAEKDRELDASREEVAVLSEKVSALQSKVELVSGRSTNPADLVDASVAGIDPTSGHVFISIGSQNRVTPGMTFEVFDDASTIVASAENGSRGKASLQILKVGDKTSTCRLLRSTKGHPVIKGDVVANAVFDPNYRFKFLVHGAFDVNKDGRATPAESDFLRERIRSWGGEVVDGSDITGDLDFIVLGSEPALPAPLPADATESQTTSYVAAREAREKYETLFKDALDAQIPVLNWNRFSTLTGGGIS
ncbi:MAG: hypothetical protein EXS10_04560 [Phycisphaerales bacterium]|nr:hypothetical protein [Phycisphaerales bacterium]